MAAAEKLQIAREATTEALRTLDGPVIVAGGDVVSRWPGWMEGAILAGEDSGAACAAEPEDPAEQGLEDPAGRKLQ
jgi:monoamine oxidase